MRKILLLLSNGEIMISNLSFNRKVELNIKAVVDILNFKNLSFKRVF